MPARTGKEFLKGLRGPREIWVDGERVTDVAAHPKLAAPRTRWPRSSISSTRTPTSA